MFDCLFPASFISTKKALLISLCVALASFSLLGINIQRADAAVDTCTWTGAASNLLTNAANWSGCDNSTTPEAGDNLIFPSGASNKNLNIDGFTTVVRFIAFTGSGYTVNRTGADSLSLDGPSSGLSAEADVTFNVPVNLGATGVNIFNNASTGVTVTFNDPVAITGSGVVNFGLIGSDGTFDFQDNITGSIPRLTAIWGAHVIVRGAANTFTAGTVGAEVDGVFECRDTSCFGNAANDIYMWGGIVEIDVSGVFTNDVQSSAAIPYDSWIKAYDNISITGTTTVNGTLNIAQYGTAGKALQFTGLMTIDPGQQINVFGNDSLNEVRFNTSITGSGDGITADNVFLELTGGNTFDGGVSVLSGAIVSVENAAGLGDDGFVSTVAADGNLYFDGLSSDITVTNPLQISGGSVALGDADFSVELAGNITLTGDAEIVNDSTCNTANDFEVSGVISGTGDLHTFASTAPCSVTIDGALPNTFVGDLIHEAGSLSLDKDLASPGNIYLQPIHIAASSVIQVLGGHTNVIGGGAYSVDADFGNEYFIFYDDETISALDVDTEALFSVCRQSTLTVDQASNTIFSGLFTNSAGCALTGVRTILKKGTGTLTIDSDQASDTTTLLEANAGTLSIDGDRSGTDVNITGGTLKGSGKVADVTGASGRFNAGNSPGCMTVTSLTLSSGFNFDEEIDGSIPCTGYDQTTSTGAVNLGGANLNMTLGFTPALGTTFTIITGSSVTGTFAGLPNNTTFVSGGNTFRINYTSTSVILTVVPISTLPATGTNAISTALTALLLLGIGFALAFASRKVNIY